MRLKERHPDLFEAAKAYEHPFEDNGKTFTWNERESLTELERPARMQAIKAEHARRQTAREATGADLTLAKVYSRRQADTESTESTDTPCLICAL